MSTIRIWGFSHQGLIRSENQDCFMVNNLVSRDNVKMDIDNADSVNDKGIMCAIADGLGGHKGGAVASEMVLTHIAEAVKDIHECSEIESAHQYINKLILECHNNLLEISGKDEAIMGMGTTIVGVYIREQFALVFHAGDSRLYCFREKKLIMLTQDHSFEKYLQALSGNYEPMSKSGIIVNCLGGGTGSRCEPEIHKLSFLPGDLLLLCSDGLTDMVEDNTMEKLLSVDAEVQIKGEKLINEANYNGGIDNITLLLIEKL